MQIFTKPIVSARNTLVALVGLGIAGGLIAAVVLYFGFVNIGARQPHGPVVHTVLHHVFKASVSNEAVGIVKPENFDDPGRIALGGQHYARTCASCHGGPELGQSPLALSLRPRPQHLPAVVDQFTDEEIYIILRDGVRFSGMGAWPADTNFREIWSIVAFLRQLPEMTAEEYAELVGSPDTSDQPRIRWQERGEIAHMDIGAQAPPMEEYYYAAPATGWRPIGLENDPLKSCAACHGLEGTGAPTGGFAPNLTLLSADYIERTLTEYARGERESGIMATVAAGLSQSQIGDLAQHYAGLEQLALGVPEIEPEVLALGQEIVHEGLAEDGVPACLTCHAADVAGEERAGPAIMGQNANYLYERLVAFATLPAEGGMAWDPMHTVAGRLAPEDRAAAAQYLASLEPETREAVPALSGDLALGREQVETVCAACHTNEMEGVATGEYPNLTLQQPAYIEMQLGNFKAHHRDSSRMQTVADGLDEAEIKALAAYVGNLEAVPSPTADRSFDEDDLAPIAQVEMLITEGDPDRGLPACSSCHGAEVVARIDSMPRLHGQNANYLDRRLATWRSADADSTISPMPRIADLLTDEERAALAEWYAAQPPLPKTPIDG